MNEEYLEKLKDFYTQKIFNSKINCKDCQNEKKFIENEDHLIFSCGNDDNSKCGNQFKIILPKYENFIEELELLKDNFKNNIDWEIINNYTNKKNELDEYNIQREKIKKILDYFYKKKINKEKEYQEEFKILYKDYEKLKNESLNIYNTLLNNEIDDSQKKELRKEYIKINKKLKENSHNIKLLYEEQLYDEIDTIKEGSVEIYNGNYSEKIKRKNKKEKKEEKEKEKEEELDDEKLIEIIIEHFKKKNGILKKKDYEKIKGNYKTKWGKSLFSSLRYLPDKKNKNPWMKQEQLEHGPIIKETEKKTEKIKLTKNWMKFLNIQKKEKIKKTKKEKKLTIEEMMVDPKYKGIDLTTHDEEFEPEPEPEPEPDKNEEQDIGNPLDYD